VVPFIPGTVPAWSDACFEPVEWLNSSQPRSDGDQGWLIIRSPATDADGWVYGTAFDHLREDRPGGRASKRANDRVRSRLWRRVAWEQPTQQQQAGAQVSTAPRSQLLSGVYFSTWWLTDAVSGPGLPATQSAGHSSSAHGLMQGPMHRSNTHVCCGPLSTVLFLELITTARP
jgi:hypothetical protein